MPYDLGRSLLLSDAVTPEALAEALLLVTTKGMSLPRALVAVRAIDSARLEAELARSDAPVLRHVVPVPELVAELPPNLVERLFVLPVRRDERTGTVDVAVADARDPHAPAEVAHWLKAPVRVVRASMSAMEAALERLRPVGAMRPLAAPMNVGPNVEPANSGGAGDTHHMVAPKPPPVPTDPSAHLPFLLTRRSPTPPPPPTVPLPRPPSMPPTMSATEFPTLESIPDSPSVLPNRRPKPPSVAPRAPSVAPRGPSLSPRAPSVSPKAPSIVPRAPATTRGPFPSSAPVPPFPDIGSIVAGMKTAAERDTVLELLVTGVRTVARRVALLVVKRDEFVGWTCTPEFGDRARLRRVKIPVTAPSVLSAALAGGARLERLLRIQPHAELIAMMQPNEKGPTDAAEDLEVAVTAMKVDGRAALVILAADVGDTLIATKRMEELARVAGDSLARLLRQKRNAS